MYSLETHTKKSQYMCWCQKNVTRVNSRGESAPQGHSCYSRRFVLKPSWEGWYGSQVSEDTKTTFPRTQQVLPKIIGHTHYQVIVIFNQFAKTATYISPKAQACSYKHFCAPLCLWFWRFMYYLGKRRELFCIIQPACVYVITKSSWKIGRGGFSLLNRSFYSKVYLCLQLVIWTTSLWGLLVGNHWGSKSHLLTR